MNTWFRHYNSAHRNDKVRHLSLKLYRFWMFSLEIASEHDGILPSFETIAFETNLRVGTVKEMVAELQRLHFIDLIDNELTPHDWHEYQYKSDNVSERVKRFRERNGNVTSNVTGNGQTRPDQNRPEQKRFRPAGETSGNGKTLDDLFAEDAAKRKRARRLMTSAEIEFCRRHNIAATHVHSCVAEGHKRNQRETYCDVPDCQNMDYEEVCEECTS